MIFDLYTHSQAYSDADPLVLSKRAVLDASINQLFGPRSEREDSVVWFENQPRAREVREGKRCYGLSNLFTRALNRSAPPAAMKVIGGKLDEVQMAVKNVVHVSIKSVRL